MTTQQKDPAIATILEIIFGFGGLPGIGWIYADKIDTGLKILLGYWLFIITIFGLFFVISILTFGLGMILIICVIPIFLLVHFSLFGAFLAGVTDFLKTLFNKLAEFDNPMLITGSSTWASVVSTLL